REIATAMTFIPDPNHGLRVIDPTTGHSLTQMSRDVPNGQRWFEFCFDDPTHWVLIKTTFTLSENDKTFQYIGVIDDIATEFNNYSGRTFSRSDFCATILPLLRAAITGLMWRYHERARQDGWTVIVEFVDTSAIFCSQRTKT